MVPLRFASLIATATLDVTACSLFRTCVLVNMFVETLRFLRSINEYFSEVTTLLVAEKEFEGKPSIIFGEYEKSIFNKNDKCIQMWQLYQIDIFRINFNIS